MPQAGMRDVQSRGQGNGVCVATRQGREEAVLEPTEGPGCPGRLWGGYAWRLGKGSCWPLLHKPPWERGKKCKTYT